MLTRIEILSTADAFAYGFLVASVGCFILAKGVIFDLKLKHKAERAADRAHIDRLEKAIEGPIVEAEDCPF